MQKVLGIPRKDQEFSFLNFGEAYPPFTEKKKATKKPH
jgi:hypothetical protein